MVIVGGGIDLSVPWVLNSAAILVTAFAGGSDAALLWAVPLILAGGGLIGALNGAAIALLRIPPIVMTLSTNVVLQGLLLIGTRGLTTTISFAPRSMAMSRWLTWPVEPSM